jgi:hypothetical protein
VLWVDADEDTAKGIRNKWNVIVQSAIGSRGSNMPKVVADSEHEFALSNGSRMVRNASGGTVDAAERVGMGDTFQFCVWTEFAWWSEPEATINALLPALEHSNPSVIIDSTPKGPFGAYYDYVKEAQAGSEELDLYFWPWWMESGYRSRAPAIDLTIEEINLVEKYGLNNFQINWRRQKMKRFKASFCTTYPETVESCFMEAQSILFDNDVILYLNRKDYPVPISKEELLRVFPVEFLPEYDGSGVDDLLFEPKWDQDVGTGYTRFYHLPSDNAAPYVLTVDPAEGIEDLSADWMAMTLLDRDANICATGYYRIPPVRVAGIVQRIAMLYGAYVCIENSSTGVSIRDNLKWPVSKEEIESNYAHSVLLEGFTHFWSGGLFRMTARTRPVVINWFMEQLNSGYIDVVDKTIFQEMITLKRFPDGRIAAPKGKGKYDDMLFALGIALEVRSKLLTRDRHRGERHYSGRFNSGHRAHKYDYLR